MSSSVDYDKSKEKSNFLMIFLVLLAIFLIVTGVISWYFTETVQNRVYIESLNNADYFPEVKKLKNYEDAMLNNYGIVDKEKGIYRIPIEKAIEKVVEQYER